MNKIKKLLFSPLILLSVSTTSCFYKNNEIQTNEEKYLVNVSDEEKENAIKEINSLEYLLEVEKNNYSIDISSSSEIEDIKNILEKLRVRNEERMKKFNLAQIAINENSNAFIHVGKVLGSWLMRHKKFVLNALKKDGTLFRYIDEELKKDEEIILEAIKNDPTNRILYSLFTNVGEYLGYSVPNNQNPYYNKYSENKAWALAAAENYLYDPITETRKKNFFDIFSFFKNDKEVILKILDKDGLALEFASDELKDDREVVLKAVKQDGLALKFASERLKNNLNIVKVSINQNVNAYHYASEQIKNNYEIALMSAAAIKKIPEALKNNSNWQLDFANKLKKLNLPQIIDSFEIISDRYLLLELIEIDPNFIKKAPDELMNDKSFLIEAINKGARIFQNHKYMYYSKYRHLFKDKDYLKTSIEKNTDAIWDIYNNRIKIGWSYPGLWYSDYFEENKDLFIKALTKDGLLFETFDDKYDSNREIIKIAVKQNGLAFKEIIWNKDLQNDREIALEAVKQNGLALEFVSDNLKADREIVLEAIKQNPNSFKFASVNIKNDKEVVLKAVNVIPSLIEFASINIKNDKDLMTQLIKRDANLLIHASNELKRNKEVILEAVKQNPKVFEIIINNLIPNDREIVDKLVSFNGLYLEIIEDHLKSDKSILLKAVKQNGLALEFASSDMKNNAEVVLEAVKQNGLALEFASSDMKNNAGIVLEAVKQNGLALEFASSDMKNNEEVVLEAVKQNGLALQFASSDMKNNEEVVLEAVKQNGLSIQFL
ncbi:DUF4116 domain-containing protein [Mycoplasmopsis edwardii]|uniref:DUF4116 domain-containing protein n=1 Tax=Mycoplasmopsis edwardii TaxID=53558 RepID=A0ACD4PHU4_9BACT|nr:DUF4116 domain-containing protein [Mycoplasmopsis edwardii]WBP84242.1 DUF4116 domain-containing protein [Mycoplasmopsis edwardii]